MEEISSDKPEKGRVRSKRSPSETLRRIFDAARSEFAERGLEGARVGNIARRARVTAQLVHHYFGSKEKLYSVVLEDAAAAQILELISIDYDSMSPVAALRHYMLIVFEQYCKDTTRLSLILDQSLLAGAQITERSRRQSLAPRLIDQFDRILKRGAGAGSFRPGLDAEKILSVAFLISAGWLMNRTMISAFLRVDLQNEAAVESWKKFSTDLLISALRP
jgi:AcrR family transcriptional regulator